MPFHCQPLPAVALILQGVYSSLSLYYPVLLPPDLAGLNSSHVPQPGPAASSQSYPAVCDLVSSETPVPAWLPPSLCLSPATAASMVPSLREAAVRALGMKPWGYRRTFMPQGLRRAQPGTGEGQQ